MNTLVWKRIDNVSRENLSKEETEILSLYKQGTRIDLDTGLMTSVTSGIDAYKADFTVTDLQAEFILLDFGVIKNLQKLDVYLNGCKIADTNCNNIELKAIVPKERICNNNSLIVVIKEGAVRDIWLKDVGLVQYTPDDFTTIENELPKKVLIAAKASSRKIINVEKRGSEAEIAFSDGKSLCVRLYEEGVVRLSLNRDDLRLVEKYCIEELDKNLKKDEQFECIENNGFTCIKSQFLKLDIYPDTIICKDNNGVILTEMSFICEEENCCGISLKLDDNEAIFGLGENATCGFNKRGYREDIWVSHDLEKCDIPVPFFFSSKKYGFYLNSSYHSIFDMGNLHKNYSLIYSMEKTFDCFFFADNNIKKIISRFSKITGKPKLPPKWAFGFWQAGMKILSRDDAEKAVRKFVELDIPIDVMCIDPMWQRDYCDLKWNDKTFPNHKEFISLLKKNNIHLILWTSPFVNKSCDMFAEGVKINAFVGSENELFQNAVWWKGCESGLLDLFDEKTIQWRGERIKELISEGVDGLKIDGGDSGDVPCTLRTSDKRTGSEVHNLYPLAFAKSTHDTLLKHNPGKRPVSWERTGFTGSGKYPCTWGGDQLADFSGSRVLIKAGQMCSLVGIPFWSEDVGGFCLSDKTSEETFIRSYQWGLMAPLSRAHGQKTLPWDYSEKACDIVADYIRLRYSMMPYIYSLAYAAIKLEENIMYPLFLDNIDDRKTYEACYQYMFGKYIMIAPIYEESETENLTASRKVYFPEGNWYDVHTWEKTHGKTEKEVSATIETLPMYYREGAIVPMMVNCMKASEYTMKELEIIIIPSDTESSFLLYDDDGESYEYIDGGFNSVKISQCEQEEHLEIRIETQNNGLKTDDYFKWRFKVLSNKENVRIHGQNIGKEKIGKFVCFETMYKMGETLVIEME